MTVGVKKDISLPPVCEKEVARYAGGEFVPLKEEPRLTPMVCYIETDVFVDGGRVSLGKISVNSKNLAKNLSGCKRALIFCATVGAEVDRLVQKYSRLSPAAALMINAFGSERAEALCDGFCHWFATERGVLLRPRFSPGYGDLPLEFQREIFALLEPEKRLGAALSESLIMSPSKTVTAIVGITTIESRNSRISTANL